MLVLRKRLFEMFIASISISLIIVAAFLLEIIPGTEYNAAFVCIIGTGIFIGVNTRQLQRCMVDLVSVKTYYKYNYLSYLIFAAVSTGLCIFAPVEFFSIIFSFTKFVRYAKPDISYQKSLLIFHALMLAVIAVVPLFLPARYKKRIFSERKMRVLCPNCKTGRDSYLIDETSPICPYLGCYNGRRCAYYVPIEKEAAN